MEDKLKRLEIKRLLQEYNFILTDIEYKTEIISENRVEFLERVDKVKRELFPNKAEEQKPQIQSQEKKESDLPEISESTKIKIKKIYREIVKITHPDRNNSDKYLDQHMRATEAFDKFNLIELYLICLDLNIPVELDSDDIGMLSGLIADKRNNSKSLEGSFIWLWINAKDEAAKENIVTLFIKQTS